MKQLLIWIFVLLALPASFLPAALAAKQSAPAGSFLKSRASTVNDLVAQVNDDAALRALYASHFGIAETDVVERLKTLRPMLLEQPVKVQYYFLDSKGKIADKVVTLPRATAVFATPDHAPLLSWPYGNPLGRAIDPVTAKGAPSDSTVPPAGTSTAPSATQASATGKTDSDSVGRSPAEIASMLSAPPAGTQTPGQAVAPQTDSAPVVVDTTPMVSMPNPTLAGPLANATPTHAGHAFWNGSVLAGLCGLAGAAGAVALFHSGGSEQSLAVDVDPSPVPEPQGVATLALGVLAGMGLLRRQRSR